MYTYGIDWYKLFEAGKADFMMHALLLASVPILGAQTSRIKTWGRKLLIKRWAWQGSLHFQAEVSSDTAFGQRGPKTLQS